MAANLGKYRLLERLAVGGTAEVFRAAAVLEDGTEDIVAIKKVLPQCARDRRFVQLLREEARILTSLQHRNIVRLRELGEMQHTLFLALEYVDGASLEALLLEVGGSLPPPLAAFVAGEICAALDYAHTRSGPDGALLSIVHRDVSPHNILVSRAGEVKLADFGIARSTLRQNTTVDGTIKGKFAYMSPEQATPGGALDGRSDLFALGAVLYELLFGSSPFQGQTEVETLERVRQGRYVLEHQRMAPPDRPLAAIVRRCLERRREDRYPTAAALLEDLRGYLTSLHEPPTSERFSTWLREERASRSGVRASPLSRALFGAEDQRGGATAVIAATPSAAPASLPAQSPERKRGRRGPAGVVTRVLEMILVAAVTATVTLGAVVYLGSRRAGAPVAPAAPTRSKDIARSSRPPDPDAAPAPAAGKDAAPEPRPALVIRTTPGRARVFLNGVFAGTSPVTAPAPREAFEVEVRHPGFKPWTERHDAPAGDLQLDAILERRPTEFGQLTINSIPWARVYLDGRLIGPTPIRGRRVSTGNHQVVLRDRSGRTLRSFVARVRRGHDSVFQFDSREP